MDSIDIQRIEELLDHRFGDHDLLQRALTHASLVDSRLQSNERLEFLGDAVLGLVVCSYLYDRYGALLEGEMTKIKSTVVSRRVCAEIAAALGLDELLRLGKGMSKRAALPGSVLAAVFESLVGALYLDGGLEVARRFILRTMQPRIELAARSGHQSNFKSVLQQTAQQLMGLTPQYIVLDEKGPDHAKCFEVAVEIGARRFGSCWGPSKKQAEQDAALQALKELGFATSAANGDVQIVSEANRQ
ncbi:MAG: ribonuclease III [Phycisphaerales bacterium]|nr:ribonuclease III [Phycisphaerales bacterium]MCI0629710.1 ribonuclease III [Phycisphaerales bacterium]